MSAAITSAAARRRLVEVGDPACASRTHLGVEALLLGVRADAHLSNRYQAAGLVLEAQGRCGAVQAWRTSGTSRTGRSPCDPAQVQGDQQPEPRSQVLGSRPPRCRRQRNHRGCRSPRLRTPTRGVGPDARRRAPSSQPTRAMVTAAGDRGDNGECVWRDHRANPIGLELSCLRSRPRHPGGRWLRQAMASAVWR